jgi:group I intron endonuclease
MDTSFTIYGLHTSDSDVIRYVGLTAAGINHRLRGHIIEAERGSTLPVHCWIRKHGGDSIATELLEVCDSYEDLLLAESYWISALETHVSDGGLNCTYGGEGSTGHKWSEERRAAIRGENHWNYGKPRSEEAVAKLRKTLEENPPPRGEQHWNYGRKHTDEHRKKRSDAQKGRKKPDGWAEYSQTWLANAPRTGAHMRWHVRRGIVNPECKFCSEVQ